ncbi:MAG: polymerase III subunit delta' protein [Candidatus Woesebacteria bacterium GW2011_GWA1_37_7]|uniref:Polymerase III subunit delta' protein n=1 Tax=Candidatus Woesebacteria bacterium GW2011_GWA1_37_7 TaxID=1618545 RepID=A0A0G0H1V0_9BACT|nr:MAG: polymerase III subunit delta' protein [Candidatus Woesebacteria bacterium GW2011_GWA1_37_7]
MHNASVMHAYLIIGNNSDQLRLEAEKISEKIGSELIPFPLKKIEDARQLLRFTKLTIPRKTAIYIEAIDEANTETANSFLKNLEEPQKNLVYILSAKSENKVLATILSRCQLIRLKPYAEKVELDEAVNFIDSDKPKKFKLLENLKRKDEAILFCLGLEKGIHKMLISSDSDLLFLSQALKASEELYLTLLKNGNVSLQLTKFVVNFPEKGAWVDI